MSNRNVNTSRVINEVRMRRLLWDISEPQYKNKIARNKSWEDIVDTLFENVLEEEKQHLVKQIQQRWKTARDAYFRTKNDKRRTLSGSAASKYIYYDELRFLTSSVKNEVDDSLNETISSPSENMDNMVPSENSLDSDMSTYQPFADPLQEQHNAHGVDCGSSQRRWSQKRKKRTQLTNQESSFERNFVTLLSNQTQDLAADDVAFFSSLGPILQSFNLKQKLEFRSRVLREAMEMFNKSN